MVSPLESAMQFLRDFGFFNVVLPFLLIFAIVFAVLEKTRIFGTETVKGEKVPRRNIDAMVAFVIAFFFVAATNLVEVIQIFLPQITFILIVIICLMLLIGAFSVEGELKIGRGLKIFLIIIVLIVILFLLLNVFGLLGPFFELIKELWGGPVLSTIIFLIIIAIVIWVVTKGPRKEAPKEEK